jgi:hypothetical protein
MAKIKWVCPGQNNEKREKPKKSRKRKWWKTHRVELMIMILSLCNLEILFEPYECFSFIVKNHSLRYLPVEVLSNQASKQLETINDALKTQRVLFHKSHDIKNKLLIIIHANKMSIQKEIIFFSNKTLSFFSSPSLWNI